MKTPNEIIQRAQIQLVLKDRLIWEDGFSDGRFHSMEEREKQQHLECSWITSQRLDPNMNAADLHLLNQTIETVPADYRAKRSFECESIEPLLWACSLADKLTGANKFMCRDYHKLLIGTPPDELCRSAAMRSEAEISRQRDTYMLWYWRCKINQEFSSIKGNTVVDAISSAFSPLEAECAKQIRRCKGDFAVGSRPFSQLTDKEKHMMERCMRWRYHALAWVLNDETWYDTGTDT